MTQIPEGMKPWNGGDGPPEDYAGGPVLLNDPVGVVDKVRLPEQWQGSDSFYRCVIAYTPKPPAYPEGMTPELAERMVAFVRIYENVNGEARAIMAELEPDPLVKAIDAAWVRLPPEWTRETFVEHMTGELRKAGASITETKQ